ncbi:GNAT family N-acetyltransferase [Photobacterium leiognathi]|uniref:GNAT family N-acetyltransferase n=1 Tax=Photobacterium leiognathi TaxID=553611 RepID=UPI0029820A53|nr:GNAT family N-acetyltransferase [Photobacterium leiognathi]
MKVRITKGTENDFMPRLKALETAHNAEGIQNFNSEQINRVDVMGLIEIDGIGGILYDVMNYDPLRACVQLLHVRKEHRGKGYGRKLVECASKMIADRGGLLVGAYCDIGDPTEFWEHMGYNINQTVNYMPMQICDSIDVCFPNSQREAITVENFLNHFHGLFQ